MHAERNKRAAILTADGEAQAAILQVGGTQKGLVLSSQGERQAAILNARALLTLQEAQAGAVRMVMGAVNDSGAPDATIQLQYMQMLPKLAENPANKVIVVPAGLAGLATSLSQFVQGATGDATHVDRG